MLLGWSAPATGDPAYRATLERRGLDGRWRSLASVDVAAGEARVAQWPVTPGVYRARLIAITDDGTSEPVLTEPLATAAAS